MLEAMARRMARRLDLRLEGDSVCPPETDVPAKTLRELEVSARLRAHVAHLVLYRERISKTVHERVVPDGAVRLVFHESSSSLANGPSLEVIGPSARPAELNLSGAVGGWTVTLQPGAAPELLGVSARELVDTKVDLGELWTRSSRRVLERLMEAADDDDRARLLQSELQTRLGTHPNPGRARVVRAIRSMFAAGAGDSVRSIADALGIGERRLQQIFAHHVGLSPRVFRRLARLHACLRAMRTTGAPDWSRLALECGFYDQSHLIHEFRDLTGLLPGAFSRRGIAGFSKTARRER